MHGLTKFGRDIGVDLVDLLKTTTKYEIGIYCPIFKIEYFRKYVIPPIHAVILLNSPVNFLFSGVS